MYRLKNKDNVIYDSMIIIYYCFNDKNHKFLEYTGKTHTLTEFLINNNIEIVVPSFLKAEIERKDIMQMIDSIISSNQITNISNTNFTVKLGLEIKFKNKFKKLQKKEWFNVVEYIPSAELLDPLRKFFESLINHPQYEEFLKKKNRDTPIPSFEDLGLMAFSKDKEYPIISNDNDLTFFAYELYKQDLSNEIFNFDDLDTYNN